MDFFWGRDKMKLQRRKEKAMDYDWFPNGEEDFESFIDYLEVHTPEIQGVTPAIIFDPTLKKGENKEKS